MIGEFFGYDRRMRIAENEFYDEKNMSADLFPLLAPRAPRVAFNVDADDLSSLFSKGRLGYIKNGRLYIGGSEVTGLTLESNVQNRKLVSFGAYLLIFPDKKYVNTRDVSDCGSLEAVFEKPDGVNASFELCLEDGSVCTGVTASASPPAQPSDGSMWIDTSVSTHTLKQYSSYLGTWSEIETVYVKIGVPNIGKNFKRYDGVTISGAPEENLNGAHIIKNLTDDSITVTGIIDNEMTSTAPLSVERRVPDMDFYCECGNRVWGCSSEKNEIYASKLGDASNWNCFEGISTDSYAVTVGSDGEFTGAVNFRGYALFFKENRMHRIYGSNPPFTVTSAAVRGVQKGSEKSLVILNETLFYKSPGGVMMFDGGLPTGISEELGGEYYSNAAAGALGDKYYICMSDKNLERSIFTYDSVKRIWHKEDNTDALEFINHNGNLFFIAADNGTKRLFAADGSNMLGNFNADLSGYTPEGEVEWCVQTGLWGLSVPENKYYSNLTLRFGGDEGARFEVFIRCNGTGEWVLKGAETVTRTSSRRLPFTAPRADHIELKICGRGRVVFYGIARTAEGGSALNVRP